MNTISNEKTLNNTRVAVPYTVSITSLQEAMQFSEMVAQSAFVPSSMRGKPADCLLAMQFGAELGLKPMQALQNVAVINGKPSIWGDAALALVKCAPDFQSIDERIEGEALQMKAICTVQRKGEAAQTRTFSVADAQRAGLWGKNVWLTYPSRMLQMRARGFALRDVFPHILKGLIFAEEASDYPQEKQETILERNLKNKITTVNGKVITPLVKRIEEEINRNKLWDSRERINKYCIAKFGDEYYGITEEQAENLARYFPIMKKKIEEEKQEEKLKKQREIIKNKITELCDISVQDDYITIAEKHYGDLNKISSEQIESLAKWIEMHRAILIPEIVKLEKQAAEIIDKAKYCDTSLGRTEEENRAKEMLEKAKEMLEEEKGRVYEKLEILSANSKE